MDGLLLALTVALACPSLYLGEACDHTLERSVRDSAQLEAHRYVRYDARWNVVATQKPIGDGQTASDAGQSTSSTALSRRSYDAVGNLLSSTDPGGTVTAFVTDGAGLVTAKTGPQSDESWTYQYDQFGQLKSKTLANPSSLAGWKGGTWKYDYRLPSGETVRETDPLGYETKRWYNARHKLLQEDRADSAPGRTGSSNKRSVKLAWNGPWLKKQVVEEGTSQSTLERTLYDHRGRVWVEVEGFSGPDADAHYTYTTNTPWGGRSTDVTQSWTSAGGGSRSGRLEVDALENVTLQSWGAFADSRTFDAAGQLTSENLSGKPERRLGYDEGLRTSSVYGSEWTTYAYWGSGKLHSETQPDLRSRRLTWDSRGLLEKEEYGRDGSFDTKQYTYDAAGNVATMRHGAGVDEALWSYSTGPRGELFSVVQPGQGGTFEYRYNERAELAGITPPAGSASVGQTFDYDYVGRPITRSRGTATWTTSWASGASTQNDPEFEGGQRTTYRVLDGRGRALVERYTGVLTDLTEVKTDFDPLDQPLRVQETRGSGNATVTFAYGDDRRLLTGITRGTESITYGRTASGQLASATSPAGTVNYGYDLFDRLETLTTGTRTTTLQWEPGGARLLDLEGGGLHECRRYDARGRLTLVSNLSPGDNCESAASPLAEYAYGYDDRGNRVTEAYRDPSNIVPDPTRYGYDAADRLTGVQYPGGTAKLYKLGPDGTRLGEKEGAEEDG